MNWFQFIGLMRSIYSGSPDPERIRRLGLLAVKIGQVHALRIDFLDPDVCRRLSELYRRDPGIPPEDFRALLREAGGPKFMDAFSSIEDKPLAAASVGQVHRAVLRSGERVVIKAVKHRFADQFRRDVRSVERLFRFVIFFWPKLARVADPLGILEDIRTYTLSELDLRNEAAGQRTLRGIADGARGSFDLSRLGFARVYGDLSGERVLVTEYLEGPTIDELLDAGTFRYEQLLELFRLHGFFMFNAGVFHGDIHPGNVIVNGDRYWFVDTGSIGRVSDRIRIGLLDFFEALGRYDYPACAERLNNMAERGVDGAAFKRFREEFIALYRDFTNATVGQVSLTRKMMQTIKLGVNSGMSFDRGIFPIIRSLMYMDGMVLRCNPGAVLLKDMSRYIAEFRAAGASAPR